MLLESKKKPIGRCFNKGSKLDTMSKGGAVMTLCKHGVALYRIQHEFYMRRLFGWRECFECVCVRRKQMFHIKGIVVDVLWDFGYDMDVH